MADLTSRHWKFFTMVKCHFIKSRTGAIKPERRMSAFYQWGSNRTNNIDGAGAGFGCPTMQ